MVKHTDKIAKGKRGEIFVAGYLQKQGYTIVMQNYRNRGGEIDIIAQKDEYMAFVEVKLRCNPLIDPLESINAAKQRSIIRTARHFLATHTIDHDCVYGFDVAVVEEKNNSLNVRYIPNAFTIFD